MPNFCLDCRVPCAHARWGKAEKWQEGALGRAWAKNRAIACNKEMRVKVPFDRARVKSLEVQPQRVRMRAIHVHFRHHPEFHALRRAQRAFKSTWWWHNMVVSYAHTRWWYAMRRAGRNYSNEQPVVVLSITTCFLANCAISALVPGS